MRNAWSETHAIFVDFAASASPRLQDARKRLPGVGTGWVGTVNPESPERP